MTDSPKPVMPKIAANPNKSGSYRQKINVGLAIKKAGFFLAPLLFVLMYLLPVPTGMAYASWITSALVIWMVLWWMTEAVPLPVTALLPAIIFPTFGIMPIQETLYPYTNPVIFLFLGGFIIATAIQHNNLHLRVALNIVRIIGTRPDRLLGGFMIASAFLSMWISNTATMLMMLPIVLSVVSLISKKMERSGEDVPKGFAACMLLGIAFSSSVGGIGTLIGTPPNAIMSGFLQQSYNLEIDFFQWMLAGIPVVVVMVFVMWFFMGRIMYRLPRTGGAAGYELISEEIEKLGSMSREEKIVTGVAATTAFLWVFKPLINEVIPFDVHDAVIAMIGALLLFMIPVSPREHRFTLTWNEAEKQLPWGVLILFGGGLSLASGVSASGLDQWMGTQFSGMEGLPPLLILFIVVIVVQATTSLMSNVASINIFLPIILPLSISMGMNPLYFIIVATMSASCAFLLPVSTANNAIAFSTGKVSIAQMVRTGIWLNLLSLPVLFIMQYLVIMPVFGIDPHVIPDWAIER